MPDTSSGIYFEHFWNREKRLFPTVQAATGDSGRRFPNFTRFRQKQQKSRKSPKALNLPNTCFGALSGCNLSQKAGQQPNHASNPVCRRKWPNVDYLPRRSETGFPRPCVTNFRGRAPEPACFSQNQSYPLKQARPVWQPGQAAA